MKLIFDVESIGLYGEGWAVGWVLIDSQWNTITEGYSACPQDVAKGTDEDRLWVMQNCPELHPTRQNPRQIRDRFWEVWMDAKQQGATIWAECAYPVEANFLMNCVADDPRSRKWSAPYPLHEIATALELAGFDPHANYPRLENEPQHHPLGDARQSTRLLKMVYERLGL
jgi:hypothetical protein